MATETATLLTLALDPPVEPPDDATSNRILDAALALAAASGIRNLTMDDVARRAGVGRMTVYRRFGDKESLVQALGVRESRRCLAALDSSTEPDAPLEEQAAAGFVTCLRLAREHPLLVRLSRIEPETVLGALTADDGALFTLMRTFVAERLRAAQRAGVVGPVEVEEAAELLVRLGITFALIEQSSLPMDDDERLAEIARRLLAPILGAARG